MSVSIASLAPRNLNDFQRSLFVVYTVALSRLAEAKAAKRPWADVGRWQDAVDAIRKAWPDDVLAIERSMGARR
jgi:hypothetical protein